MIEVFFSYRQGYDNQISNDLLFTLQLESHILIESHEDRLRGIEFEFYCTGIVGIYYVLHQLEYEIKEVLTLSMVFSKKHSMNDHII